jgi:hypothetical protein
MTRDGAATAAGRWRSAEKPTLVVVLGVGTHCSASISC